MTRDELLRLGPLYRQAVSDLALLRLRDPNSEVVAFLNTLVGRGHGLLYSERRPASSRLAAFLSTGFPRLVVRCRLYIFLAAALFLAGGTLAAALTASDSHAASLFLAAFDNREEEVDFYRDLPKNLRDPERPVMAAQLMTNNIRVAILAFAVGILGAAPTLLLLFWNGLPLGALAVLQHRAGYDLALWSFLLPHGIPELTAIFIAGGAGMRIGYALVAPGDLSRSDALRLAGADAIRLLFGTAALLVIAGFIEAFLSPAALPATIKFVFAGAMALALAGYFRRGSVNRA